MTTALRDPVQETRRALREARVKDPLMTERQARAFVSAFRDAVIPEDHARRMYWAHTHPTPDQVAVAKDATPAPTPARRLVQAVAAVPAPPKPQKVMTPAMEAQRRSRNGNPIAAQVAERIRDRVRELRQQHPKHTAGMVLPIIVREFGYEIKLTAFYQTYWSKKPKGVVTSETASRKLEQLPVKGAGGDAAGGQAKAAHPVGGESQQPETDTTGAGPAKAESANSGQRDAPAPSTLPTCPICGAQVGAHRNSLPQHIRLAHGEDAYQTHRNGGEPPAISRRTASSNDVEKQAQPILQVFDLGDGFVRVQLSMQMRSHALAGFLAGMGEGMRGE